MNVEHNNNKLNETEIICPSELSLDEKNTYNDSILKSLKESQYSLNKKSNILLNALKEFSNRYDIDDRNIMKSKKFLISFKDLISIIKFALECQIKLNNSMNEYLNEISQDFINNLSYYIFSFEKIDISKHNDYNTNYNNYYSFERTNDNLDNKSTKINTKNKNEEEKQNINKNKKIQENKSNKNISVNKSAFLNIGSPKRKKENNKKNDIFVNRNRKNNKSVEKRSKSNANVVLEFQREEKNIKKKLNRSMEKRRNKNDKELNKGKNSNSLSIFTACENLKNSSFIGKASKQGKTSGNEQNNNLNKNIRKNTYYNQYNNFGIGIKRKIIGNSIIRPSNMANKLLLKGINYINEFKNLKEEESKKKY